MNTHKEFHENKNNGMYKVINSFYVLMNTKKKLKQKRSKITVFK